MTAEHFLAERGGVPTAPGRFVDVDAIEALEILPGLRFRPVAGERSLTNIVTLDPYTEAPMHWHEEEQTVLVLEGEFDFTIEGETRRMRAGDMAVIPAWTRHGARTYESACKEVDFFSPPRATLVDHARSQVGEGVSTAAET